MQSVGFLVALKAKGTEGLDVMNVHLAAQPSLGLATLAASVSISPTGGTGLSIPVGAVIGELAALPKRVILARKEQVVGIPVGPATGFAAERRLAFPNPSRWSGESLMAVRALAFNTAIDGVRLTAIMNAEPVAKAALRAELVLRFVYLALLASEEMAALFAGKFLRTAQASSRVTPVMVRFASTALRTVVARLRCPIGKLLTTSRTFLRWPLVGVSTAGHRTIAVWLARPVLKGLATAFAYFGYAGSDVFRHLLNPPCYAVSTV